ncbi:hypothetical protein ACQY0O_002579 [Thecaphora frezii]
MPQDTPGPSSSAQASPAPSPLFHQISSESVEGILRQGLPPYSEGDNDGRRNEATSGIAHGAGDGSSSAWSAAQGSFFDIAPRSDATSFQVGYLGLRGFGAWVKGDVLVKLDERSRSMGGYSRCIVELKAIERAVRGGSAPGSSLDANEADTEQEEEVELFSACQVLWDVTAATSSAAPDHVLPSTMPFSFPLTPDLPHCIHSKSSSLAYHVEARLISARPTELPDAVKAIPVHLTRYTRPGPLDARALREIDGAELRSDEFSLEPFTWTVHSPTTAYVQLNKTIFRRAEPIDVKVRIPPPSQQSVTEKGLKLRAVEADLVRLIRVKQPDRAVENGARKSLESSGGYPTPAEEKAALARLYGEATSSSSQAESASQGSPSVAVAAAPVVHEALLAHSGKLCRFHSQRPVLLRLTLHPPFDPANMPHPHPDHDALASGPVFGRGGGGGCESISQETVLHVVTFEVRIKVAILGGQGERRDIVCAKTVTILPGAAGLVQDDNGEGGTPEADGPTRLPEKRAEKQAEKGRGPEHLLGQSSDGGGPFEAELLEFGMDDEYDGYEDVGRGLDELINEADGVDSPGPSTSHEERLEQLRQLLERSEVEASQGPPPSLLESRHDLQVEVEVEGVGLAMPRHRHPADTFPEGARPLHDGLPRMLLPPPPIDALLQPHYDDLRPTYLESAADEPPPPLSPTDSDPGPFGVEAQGRQGSLRTLGIRRSALHEEDASPSVVSSRSSPPPPHSPPRPSYLHLEPGPAYEAIVTGEHGRDATIGSSDSAGGSHNEPPPYIDSSLLQRSGVDDDDAELAPSMSPRRTHGTNDAEADDDDDFTPPSSHGLSSSAAARPPAYGAYVSPPIPTTAADEAATRANARTVAYSRPSLPGGPPGYED